MNFKVRLLQQAAKFSENSVNFCMFFGTSILKGFWDGFGRVLGRQNPRFSHFLGCFFDKNRYKIEVKKKYEKSRESEVRPLPSQEVYPSPPNLHASVLVSFSLKISTPCGREANFRVFP